MRETVDNIFFVLTPIQLVNAYEAKFNFCSNNESNLLVVFAENSITLNQLNSLIGIQKWDKVLYLFNEVNIKGGGTGSNPIIKVLRVLSNIYRCKKLLKRISGTQRVFVGNFDNPYMYFMVCRLPNSKIIALDEGNNTLRRMAWNSGNEPFYVGGPVSENKKNTIFRFLARNKRIPKTNISFFTVFENQLADQRIVYKRNTFEYTRNQFKIDQKKQTNEVWFLGGPFVSLGVMKKEVYFELIKKIKNYYKDYDFVYIRHRAEREIELPPVKIKTFDYPVEFQMVVDELLPQKVISFHSGASINLHLLFKDIQVVNLTLPASVMIKGEVDTERLSMYEYYKGLESSNLINLELSTIDFS